MLLSKREKEEFQLWRALNTGDKLVGYVRVPLPPLRIQNAGLRHFGRPLPGRCRQPARTIFQAPNHPRLRQLPTRIVRPSTLVDARDT